MELSCLPLLRRWLAALLGISLNEKVFFRRELMFTSAPLTFPLTMDLIYPVVAATADSVTGSRISIFKLSSWNRDEQLSRNIPGLQCQVMTTEASPSVD